MGVFFIYFLLGRRLHLGRGLRLRRVVRQYKSWDGEIRWHFDKTNNFSNLTCRLDVELGCIKDRPKFVWFFASRVCAVWVQQLFRRSPRLGRGLRLDKDTAINFLTLNDVSTSPYSPIFVKNCSNILPCWRQHFPFSISYMETICGQLTSSFYISVFTTFHQASNIVE